MKTQVFKLTLGIVALVIVLLFFVGDTKGATLLTPQGTPVGAPWQTWVDTSKLPVPAGNITLDIRSCSSSPGSASACYYNETIVIPEPFTREVFGILVGGPRFTIAQQALLHELGHWVDAMFVTEEERVQFAQMINRPTQPWRQGPNATSERFAQAFMLCALIPEIPKHRQFKTYQYLWAPSQPMQQKVCSFMRNIVGG